MSLSLKFRVIRTTFCFAMLLFFSACSHIVPSVSTEYRFRQNSEAGLVVISAKLYHQCFYLRPVLEFYHLERDEWLHLEFQNRARFKQDADALSMFHVLELPKGKYYFDGMKIDVYQGSAPLESIGESAVYGVSQTVEPLDYEFEVVPNKIQYIGRVHIATEGCIDRFSIKVTDSRMEDLTQMEAYLKNYTSKDVVPQVMTRSGAPHPPLQGGVTGREQPEKFL